MHKDRLLEHSFGHHTRDVGLFPRGKKGWKLYQSDGKKTISKRNAVYSFEILGGVPDLTIDEGADIVNPEEADTRTSPTAKPRLFLCKICKYFVCKDKAEHESQYVHNENISRLLDNRPIIGKVWHCPDCGVSMHTGYLDKHLSQSKHKGNVEDGKKTYTLVYQANLNVLGHRWKSRPHICTCSAQCSDRRTLMRHKEYFGCL